MYNINCVKVLQIKLFAGTIEKFNDILIKENEKNSLCVSATGAHGIITARRNRSFKLVLDNFYLNLPDGMPGVWIGRLKGARKMRRCYGPDVFKEVLLKTAKLKINHYLCGGKPGVAEDLRRICIEKFNNNNVVGTYSPPFREMRDNEFRLLADNINSKNTTFIWIGLSTPKQEFFANKLAEYTNVNFIITVGAAFDFHTGRVRQAPQLVQKFGMEWLFRLVMEPRRLWKRYFEIVPLFIWYNFLEFIKGDFFTTEIKELNNGK